MRSVIASFVLILLLAACTTPGNQPQASDAMALAIKSRSISDGNAHVYAFLGKWHHLLSDTDLAPSNFIVNGTSFGGLNNNECMFIELPPGHYSFSWQERAPASVAITTGPLQIDLAANQNAFISMDHRDGIGMFFGLVGALADGPRSAMVDRSADGLQAIQKMKIVLPNNVRSM